MTNRLHAMDAVRAQMTEQQPMTFVASVNGHAQAAIVIAKQAGPGVTGRSASGLLN